MDDQTRSIIRNVKGPGTHTYNPPWRKGKRTMAINTRSRGFADMICGTTVRENDILCLLESEREARRLR